MYNEGDIVRVSSDNDNENYDDFRDKDLVVDSYESSKDGQLLKLKTVDGEDVPFSIYEYEVE
jgi:hypothetical protein